MSAIFRRFFPARDPARQAEVAESRRQLHALMPSIVPSWTDLPQSRRADVRALVHTAASQSLTDVELAHFVRLGLEGRYPTSGRWCVCASRGTFLTRVRYEPGTRALVTVPCLAVDLTGDGCAPPGLIISVLLFQPMGDKEAAVGRRGAHNRAGG